MRREEIERPPLVCAWIILVRSPLPSRILEKFAQGAAHTTDLRLLFLRASSTLVSCVQLIFFNAVSLEKQHLAEIAIFK